MRPLAKRWPAILWALAFIVAPLVIPEFGWSIPHTVAYPIGLATPVFAAIWRLR